MSGKGSDAYGYTARMATHAHNGIVCADSAAKSGSVNAAGYHLEDHER